MRWETVALSHWRAEPLEGGATGGGWKFMTKKKFPWRKVGKERRRRVAIQNKNMLKINLWNNH